jgi:dCMP deaminase
VENSCTFGSDAEREVYETRSNGIIWRHYRNLWIDDCPLTAAKLHRFYGVAQAIAQLSRDPSTKVGALIFGKGYEIKAQGWNGAPRGCAADTDERYGARDEKLWWAAHAELNAIVNAARVGTPLEGSALLSTHYPCMGCAKAIVQAGIKQVVCPEPDVAFGDRWAEDIARTKRLFYECGVHLITFEEQEG